MVRPASQRRALTSSLHIRPPLIVTANHARSRVRNLKHEIITRHNSVVGVSVYRWSP